jgi:hypothetical protein
MYSFRRRANGVGVVDPVGLEPTLAGMLYKSGANSTEKTESAALTGGAFPLGGSLLGVTRNPLFRVAEKFRGRVQVLRPISAGWLRANTVHAIFIHSADRERNAALVCENHTLAACDELLVL